MMPLTPALERKLWQDIAAIEGEQQMPFVTRIDPWHSAAAAWLSQSTKDWSQLGWWPSQVLPLTSYLLPIVRYNGVIP